MSTPQEPNEPSSPEVEKGDPASKIEDQPLTSSFARQKIAELKSNGTDEKGSSLSVVGESPSISRLPPEEKALLFGEIEKRVADQLNKFGQEVTASFKKQSEDFDAKLTKLLGYVEQRFNAAPQYLNPGQTQAEAPQATSKYGQVINFHGFPIPIEAIMNRIMGRFLGEEQNKNGMIQIDVGGAMQKRIFNRVSLVSQKLMEELFPEVDVSVQPTAKIGAELVH